MSDKPNCCKKFTGYACVAQSNCERMSCKHYEPRSAGIDGFADCNHVSDYTCYGQRRCYSPEARASAKEYQ